MMEAIRSSKMSVVTRATWCDVPEDGILHSHHCENFKCYINQLWLLIETTAVNSNNHTKNMWKQSTNFYAKLHGL
jgi:hypothetical protein